VQWAVDGDNVALAQHLFQALNTTAANFLLDLRLQWLVVVVEELLAVEWLQSTQNTLSDTTNSHSTNDLALQIVLVLGSSGNIPVTCSDLLVGWDEISDEDEDGHEDVLGHRYDIGAGDFSNSDTTVGGVCGVEVDMVGTDTGSDSNLELLRLGQSLCGEITGVEAVGVCSASECMRNMEHVKPQMESWAKRSGGATHGVVMMTSASTSSWSNFEFSPSLSEVVTNVCP
jgi:hypothetical protein